MKTIALTLTLALANVASASCIDNISTDTGNVCTTFTFGTIPVLQNPYAIACGVVTSQDDVVTSGGRVCPTGFFGGGSLQISLPNDPTVDAPLVLYTCRQTNPIVVTSGPVNVAGNTQDATYTVVCDSWTGNINYHAVNRRVPVGGRGNPFAWRWLNNGGSGSLELLP